MGCANSPTQGSVSPPPKEKRPSAFLLGVEVSLGVRIFCSDQPRLALQKRMRHGG